MEQEHPLDYFEEKPERHKLYAKETILLFSIVYTVLFGVMLYLWNLKIIGKWQKGIVVVLAGFLYHSFAWEVVQRFSIPFLVTFGVNLLGGLLLVGPIWNRQIGRDFPFNEKSRWLPFALSTILLVAYFLLRYRYFTEFF